jgi:hypothetical protein
LQQLEQLFNKDVQTTKKLETPFHHSQTSTKVHQEERKMKRDKMKEKKKI